MNINRQQQTNLVQTIIYNNKKIKTPSINCIVYFLRFCETV